MQFTRPTWFSWRRRVFFAVNAYYIHDEGSLLRRVRASRLLTGSRRIRLEFTKTNGYLVIAIITAPVYPIVLSNDNKSRGRKLKIPSALSRRTGSRLTRPRRARRRPRWVAGATIHDRRAPHRSVSFRGKPNGTRNSWFRAARRSRSSPAARRSGARRSFTGTPFRCVSLVRCVRFAGAVSVVFFFFRDRSSIIFRRFLVCLILLPIDRNRTDTGYFTTVPVRVSLDRDRLGRFFFSARHSRLFRFEFSTRARLPRRNVRQRRCRGRGKKSR